MVEIMKHCEEHGVNYDHLSWISSEMDAKYILRSLRDLRTGDSEEEFALPRAAPPENSVEIVRCEREKRQRLRGDGEEQRGLFRERRGEPKGRREQVQGRVERLRHGLSDEASIRCSIARLHEYDQGMVVERSRCHHSANFGQWTYLNWRPSLAAAYEVELDRCRLERRGSRTTKHEQWHHALPVAAVCLGPKHRLRLRNSVQRTRMRSSQRQLERSISSRTSWRR